MENPVIQVNNLKKNYGNKQVLQGINMQIHAGEIIGYLGSNGAGKSTTVKILCGILHQFEGEIRILGQDLRKDETALKHRIGYIPENAILYEPLTPLEYLEFIGNLYGLPSETARQKSKDLLQLFEMASQADKRIAGFSKGMKQKIHIISALLHNPDLLFMDEPLNGLDANSVIIVKEMVTQLAREGRTIFYCSHLMDIVEKISSRIILLDNGRIAADGTASSLKAQFGADTLENLFARLTGNTGHMEKAEKIINVFEKDSL